MSSTPVRLSSISAVIPCYNEADNIVPAYKALHHALDRLASRHEIIFVNDGSQDQTGTIAASLARRHAHVRVIHHPRNFGYGMALRSGFSAARYSWLFFTDGDLQFDIDELVKFVPHTSKYNVIIGYRRNRAEGQLRALNARLFKLYVDLLFRVHVKDIDCAFKLLKTSLIQAIPFRSTGAMVNAEMLYRLKKQGEPFKQVPVTHYPRRFGTPTGNNVKVILRAGYEALSLYLFMKFGWQL